MYSSFVSDPPIAVISYCNIDPLNILFAGFQSHAIQPERRWEWIKIMIKTVQ